MHTQEFERSPLFFCKSPNFFNSFMHQILMLKVYYAPSPMREAFNLDQYAQLDTLLYLTNTYGKLLPNQHGCQYLIGIALIEPLVMVMEFFLVEL